MQVTVVLFSLFDLDKEFVGLWLIIPSVTLSVPPLSPARQAVVIESLPGSYLSHDAPEATTLSLS